MKNLCIPMITAQDVHGQRGKKEPGGKGAQGQAGNRTGRAPRRIRRLRADAPGAQGQAGNRTGRGCRGKEAEAGRHGGLRPGRPLPWHAAGACLFGDAASAGAAAVRAATGPASRTGGAGSRRGITGAGRLRRRARPSGRRCVDRRPPPDGWRRGEGDRASRPAAKGGSAAWLRRGALFACKLSPGP